MEADLADIGAILFQRKIGLVGWRVGAAGAQPGLGVLDMIGKGYARQIARDLEIIEVARDGCGIARLRRTEQEARREDGRVQAHARAPRASHCVRLRLVTTCSTLCCKACEKRICLSCSTKPSLA